MIINPIYTIGKRTIVPIDAPTSFSAESGNGEVTLTWTDPENKSSETGQTLATWEYTKILRKIGSQPSNDHDGELVVLSSVKNQYQSAGYVDEVENGQTYYYAAYAYSAEGGVSEGAFTTATPKAGTPISSLSEGTLIKMNESGAPVEFYVAKINYEEGLNGAGRVLVVRKDTYDDRVWDNGNVNAYASSDLDSWFNSTYKNMLDADIRSLIGTTKIRYTPGNGNNTVGTLERAIFALSLTELGQSHTYANTEGSALPITSTLRIAYRNGSATTQWTRSPNTNRTNVAWWLNSGGGIYDSVCNGSGGSRPAFTLPSTITVDENMNVIVPSSTALQAA